MKASPCITYGVITRHKWFGEYRCYGYAGTFARGNEVMTP